MNQGKTEGEKGRGLVQRSIHDLCADLVENELLGPKKKGHECVYSTNVSDTSLCYTPTTKYIKSQLSASKKKQSASALSNESSQKYTTALTLKGPLFVGGLMVVVARWTDQGG